MQPTHIRLTPVYDHNGRSVLLPIAGTKFRLMPNNEMYAIPSEGHEYLVKDSLASIEAALSGAVVGWWTHPLESEEEVMVTLTRAQIAMLRSLVYGAIKPENDTEQSDFLDTLVDQLEQAAVAD